MQPLIFGCLRRRIRNVLCHLLDLPIFHFRSCTLLVAPCNYIQHSWKKHEGYMLQPPLEEASFKSIEPRGLGGRWKTKTWVGHSGCCFEQLRLVSTQFVSSCGSTSNSCTCIPASCWSKYLCSTHCKCKLSGIPAIYKQFSPTSPTLREPPHAGNEVRYPNTGVGRLDPMSITKDYWKKNPIMVQLFKKTSQQKHMDLEKKTYFNSFIQKCFHLVSCRKPLRFNTW